ncbi:hypothetical protein LY474_02525 [Myxococcus stipitatus]|uniref:InlB B-repeat-containing protein n=1 Tax=Myxococcus stipitatus TaxID=83455 RepID=UPI001F489C61|nr:hypothetical protein [Myxococcus stipitatus]MCE9666677.1 hypothetical protein [Myxococcus stipitatus]
MRSVVLSVAVAVLAACGAGPEEGLAPETGTQKSAVSITVEDQIVTRLPSSSGASLGYSEYLPPGYLTSTERYPTIIHLNGMGELGRATTQSELYTITTKHGALKHIRESATWKTYFGQKKAMVFSPQGYDNYSPEELRPFIQFIVANYRVDPTRLYLTGLSMGGWGTWRYARLYGNELAAIAPFATNIGAPGDTLTLLDGTAVWAGNSFSERGANISWLLSFTKVYGQYTALNPPSTEESATRTYLFDKTTKAWTSQPGLVATGTAIARQVNFAGAGHFGWTETYNQQAFWDWMFAQQRGGTPTPTQYTLTVNSGSGDGSYASGTQVTITADAPASGYVFDRWTGATVTSATSSTTTLTMPAAATTVTATYKLAPSTTYVLTVNGGSGDGSYAAGTQVTITADAPVSGYVFDQWTGASVASATSATTTLTMPAAAATVTATYKLSGSTGVSITTEDQLIGRLTTATGAPLPYAEYLPPGYLTSPTTSYPLILNLHDSDASGTTSTEAQLVEAVSRYGPLQLIRTSAAWKTYFGQEQVMVFAPRSAGGTWNATQLDALLDFLVAHYRVDTRRIYVMGQLLGGHGAWNYGYNHGDRVAALATIGANIGAPGPALTNLVNVPVWMVDNWVTASATTAQHSWLRGLTKAYGWDQYLTFNNPASALTYLFDATTDTWSTQAGAYAAGTAPIRFTVYPQGANYGTPTYEDPAFWDWMFAQQRP